MRIHIRSGRIRLFFWLPLSFIKSRLAGIIFAELLDDSSAKRKNKNKIEVDCENCEIAETAAESDNFETNEAVNDAVVAVAENSTENTQQLTAEAQEPSAETDKKKFVIDRVFLKNIYDVLKNVVKKSGHFTLVDVDEYDEKDGKTRVKITI